MLLIETKRPKPLISVDIFWYLRTTFSNCEDGVINLTFHFSSGHLADK